MKTFSSLTLLVFLSIFAFGTLADDVTYESLFSLDPKSYENKCLDMGNVITNLDGAINEINKMDIGAIKASKQQIEKIKPTLIEMKTHCEEYLKQKEDQQLDDFSKKSNLQEQKLSRDQFQINLEEADQNRLKLEQKLDKINEQKSRKMKENFNSAAVAKDQWLVENGVTQEQLDSQKVVDNFDDSIEALDQFEEAYGVVHEDVEERDLAREKFVSAQKISDAAQVEEIPAQNQFIQGKKHRLHGMAKNKKEVKKIEPVKKVEPAKKQEPTKKINPPTKTTKKEEKKEVPKLSALSIKKLQKQYKQNIISAQKAAKKELKVEQQRVLEGKMISFQNTEIKFHEKMKHLQKILGKQMKGMKLGEKTNETPDATSSAKFLERTFFIQFLSILTETASSVNSMEENELAQNLALLQVKMEEMTKIFEAQNNNYSKVQELIDKKDTITQMMKEQC